MLIINLRILNDLEHDLWFNKIQENKIYRLKIWTDNQQNEQPDYQFRAHKGQKLVGGVLT